MEIAIAERENYEKSCCTRALKPHNDETFEAVDVKVVLKLRECGELS